MIRTYRTGAIGALLDEYEKAISELNVVIKGIPDQQLTFIFDPLTKDENCRSLETILSHVVHSGYGYAIKIHNLKGDILERPAKIFHTTIEEYLQDLNHVFSFTENTFKGIKDQELEQLDDSKKIKMAWGQLYDIEQLMEHAIVHILRHRRQIEKINWDQLK
jgi:uncharacterized damage-inducible protein DinB